MSDSLDIFAKVLDALDDAHVISSVILIGGWAQYLYRIYFNDPPELSALRTVDVDLLFSRPPKISSSIPLEPIFERIGLHRSFNLDGSTKFVSREGEVEFLIPDRGKGDEHAYPIHRLGITAQSLRFLNMLTYDTIEVKFGAHNVYLPDPIRFCFNKLIVSERRISMVKQEKDLRTAIELAQLLHRLPEWRCKVSSRFNELPPKQKACVIRLLQKANNPLCEDLASSF